MRSINGNATVTIVTWSGKAEGSVGKGDVMVWSGANGRLDINSADALTDTGYDKAYNNKYAQTKQIIERQVNPGNASKL